MMRRTLIALAIVAAVPIVAWLATGETADAGPDRELGIAALSTAPQADERVREVFAGIAPEAGFDTSEIRAVGEAEGTRWFLAPGRDGSVCLLSLHDGAWGGGCKSNARPDYDGGLTGHLALSQTRQVTAIVAPDGYSAVTVTGGSDVEVTQPRRNVAFAVGSGDAVVELSGGDLPPIEVPVVNRVRLAAASGG